MITNADVIEYMRRRSIMSPLIIQAQNTKDDVTVKHFEQISDTCVVFDLDSGDTIRFDFQVYRSDA